jgi:hypothetical protein
MNATRRSTLMGASALLLTAYAAALPAFGSPPPVDLGEAGNFTILAETLISTTGGTHIVGNLGLSPNPTSDYTGFGQALAPSGQYSTTVSAPSLVSGRMYAADNTPPTPSILTTAIRNMMAAFTDAAGRAPDALNRNSGLAGEIGGLTLAPGVYAWTSSSPNVTIHSNLTLSGNATDVWIFQIPGTLDLGSAVAAVVQIQLGGAAQAKNVFWQVSGGTTLHDNCVFNGNILDQTQIAMDPGAVLNGKALAQTAVTLSSNAVSSSSAGYVGANAPGPAQAILFPSPAKGGTVTVVYGMFATGQATVLIWNDRGDLVAKAQEQQLAGTQKTEIPVGSFAPGVYLYRVDLRYASGEVRSDVKKFTVIK